MERSAVEEQKLLTGNDNNDNDDNNDNETDNSSITTVDSNATEGAEWQQVYHTGWFRTLTTDDEFFSYFYFQTFGGGPEGGYIVSCGDTSKVYKVSRSWGTRFQPVLLEGQKILIRFNESTEVRIVVDEYDIGNYIENYEGDFSYWSDFKEYMDCKYGDDPLWKFCKNGVV